MTQIVALQVNTQSDYAVGVEQGAIYVVRGPDGTRAVFNDPTDIDHVGFLTEPPSGLDSPEVRESSDLIVEGDGGVHGNFYFGRRPWTFSGMFDPRPNPTIDFTDVLTEVARNLVPNPRGATGWATSHATWLNPGAVLSVNPAGAPDNGPYFDVVTPGVAFAEGVATQIASAVIPGATYRIRIFLHGRGDTDDLGVLIGATNTVVTRFGEITGNAPNGWLSRLVTWTAPSDAVGPLHLAIRTATTKATTFAFALPEVYVDQSMPATFFDGSTYANGYPQRTAWAGTPNASASILYDVDRQTKTAAAVTNRRINRLQRATRALRGDCSVAWTPQGGVPVRILGRRQALRLGNERFPKTFQFAGVSSERRIQSQAVQSSAAAGAATITARNDGNTDSPLTITLLGAWTNPIITSPTGEQIRLTLTSVAGDTIVIDSIAKTITKNGVSVYSALQFPASKWFELAPGDNILSPSGVGTGGTWRVDWRSSWE